ncbi:hypothetical protein FJTKL_14641 [Diaporthe vaccinii]|uniref:Uncharacterized protein n=1 Tax=Diaporthe vaccinii TaxID=105482 RepID=A0ABR4E773_9PEZI
MSQQTAGRFVGKGGLEDGRPSVQPGQSCQFRWGNWPLFCLLSSSPIFFLLVLPTTRCPSLFLAFDTHLDSATLLKQPCAHPAAGLPTSFDILRKTDRAIV